MSPAALRFLLLSIALAVSSVFIYVRAVGEGAPPATALTAAGVTVVIALSIYSFVARKQRAGFDSPNQKRYLIRALIAFAVLNAIITLLAILVLPKAEMRTPAIVGGFWTILPVVVAAALRRR